MVEDCITQQSLIWLGLLEQARAQRQALGNDVELHGSRWPQRNHEHDRDGPGGD